MKSSDWRDRPETSHFGPASWQSSPARPADRDLRAAGAGHLEVIGLVVNRLRPEALQRARLDVIDRPLRVIPALPGTDVTRVTLPHCPASGWSPRRFAGPSGSSSTSTALRW